MTDADKTRALLFSETEPNEEQRKRFQAFLEKKYGEGTELEWRRSNAFPGGFRLEVGSEVYDWSVGGRFRQLREALKSVPKSNGNVIPLIRRQLSDWKPEAEPEEIGSVEAVGDGVARVRGLSRAEYGEILVFTGGVSGMVQDIKEDELSCILFDDDEGIIEGSSVLRTGRVAGIPVGEAFLGRVVNALGVPVDEKGEIQAASYFPIESRAPGIVERQSVNTPLETGILCIDSMFPIGRGQRELIIGDRQTGKTAIAIDTIVNQKDKDVVCIYVAIGQKASSVAQFVENLRKRDAMKYTIVVNASASEAPPLQYIAPYAGCALGEYFMKQGRDVLIVYDDLSKHAVAYRALSLLLDRSPGREAYPGDVFYLHSRLLERSARLSDEIGGGSMTALPIVETQAGDVSAYIPTNVISITDGQIFLETDLFFSGQRPAVNVGLSVSRVGGDAQTKAMKKAVGSLRIDLAQYREMEIFTQFASDLDESTKRQLEYGQGLMRMLRQPQYHAYSQADQVVILTTALAKGLTGIKTDDIDAFKDALTEHFRENEAELYGRIQQSGQLSDEDRSAVTEKGLAFAEKFAASKEKRE